MPLNYRGKIKLEDEIKSNSNKVLFDCVVETKEQGLLIKGLREDVNKKADRGKQGLPGKDGADGRPGKDGKDGVDGKDGNDGQHGVDGKAGKNGKDGYTPIKGKDYFDGDKGAKGDIPRHEWDDTKLRFEKPNGEWGEWVELKTKERDHDKGSYLVSGGGYPLVIEDDLDEMAPNVRRINFGDGLDVSGDNERVTISVNDTEIGYWQRNAIDAELTTATAGDEVRLLDNQILRFGNDDAWTFAFDAANGRMSMVGDYVKFTGNRMEFGKNTLVATGDECFALGFGFTNSTDDCFQVGFGSDTIAHFGGSNMIIGNYYSYISNFGTPAASQVLTVFGQTEEHRLTNFQFKPWIGGSAVAWENYAYTAAPTLTHLRAQGSEDNEETIGNGQILHRTFIKGYHENGGGAGGGAYYSGAEMRFTVSGSIGASAEMPTKFEMLLTPEDSTTPALVTSWSPSKATTWYGMMTLEVGASTGYRLFDTSSNTRATLRLDAGGDDAILQLYNSSNSEQIRLYAGGDSWIRGGTFETGAGRIKNTTRITSGSYNILTSDEEIFVDTDGGSITVNLPAGVDGQTYRIINTGSSGNDVTVAPNGAELLTGVNASRTLSDSSVIILTYETTEGWW